MPTLEMGALGTRAVRGITARRGSVRWWTLAALVSMASWTASPVARADEPPTLDEAAAALRKACQFYVDTVATEGGYLWRYSADLSRREGEGKATDSMVWVQPPGTPAVGKALLDAYRATGDTFYLDASRAAARCLLRGQLQSGGWGYFIEFDPDKREKFAYRADGRSSGSNTSVLDDNTTQATLRFLMRLDAELNFTDRELHEAIRYALDHLLAAQYANGAWPQRFAGPADPATAAPRRAAYPETWERTWPKPKYESYYTFNDNAMGDVVALMLEAARTYGDARYRAAAERCGEFILMAQMPEPQPAWAQQYDEAMHPAWARKFEPPALSGSESQAILGTLLALYAETGNAQYVAPVPRALEYLESSRLSDGRLARFYELQTNRPLYFTRDYVLTYDDGDVPTHYAFKVSTSGLARARREYEALMREPPSGVPLPSAPVAAQPERYSRPSREQARKVHDWIEALDDRGRWLEAGRLDSSPADEPILTNATFIKRVEDLARYVGGLRAAAPRD